MGSGLGGGIASTAAVAVAAGAQAKLATEINEAEAAAQINAARPSFENRHQEWLLQYHLASHEVFIGEQQITLARAHTDIVHKERLTAETQRAQARATMDFLANKFTNAELYEWIRHSARPRENLSNFGNFGRLPSQEEDTMRQICRSHIFDHLGLVAAMFDELGIGDVIDQATQQHPDMRIVTAGTAVKAMVLNGLGFVNQPLYLVPHFFQNKPIARLFASCIEAKHLNDDALGRALDTLYAHGVTELYRLIAATAARRLRLAPTFAHLDRTSFHVDGRYHSDEAPDEQVIHITRGYSRDHRPDLNQVRLDLIVEPQAGMPVLMLPLSGNSRDGRDFGQVVSQHIAQLHTTYGMTYLVADGALYSAENLQKLSETRMKWITRVPATLSEAQAALAQAEPQTMAPLMEGSRYQGFTSTDGEVAQRWLLISSEARHPQAQHTVDKQLGQQRAKEVSAFQQLCRTAFACETDAQQALSTFAQGLQSTSLHQVTLCSTPRYRKRGRPGHGAQPDQVLYYIDGALASSVARREALVAQQSCFILATNELDDTQLSPEALLTGSQGQQHAERGFRFLKDPQFLASSLSLKTPERIMALLMVMTVCLLVYAALEYRIRTALKDHDATFPNQKGAIGAKPNRAVGLSLFCGDSSAPEPWAMATRVASHGGAPAPAPTPGETLWTILLMNIHENARGNAECQMDERHPQRRLQLLPATGHRYGVSGTAPASLRPPGDAPLLHQGRLLGSAWR